MRLVLVIECDPDEVLEARAINAHLSTDAWEALSTDEQAKAIQELNETIGQAVEIEAGWLEQSGISVVQVFEPDALPYDDKQLGQVLNELIR